MNEIAICIQAFVKTKELERLFSSLNLSYLQKQLNVFVYVDSCKKMPYVNREGWVGKNREVIDFLSKIKSSHGFNNFNFYHNSENLGTAATCYKGISDCFQKGYKYVIFTEDDTLFSKDAGSFFESQKFQFENDKCWAILGESPFFDSKGKNVPNEFTENLKAFVIDEGLFGSISKLSWVNSTNFMVSRMVWERFGHIRGQKMGAIEFGEKCKNEGGFSVYPILPRVTDTGMISPDGYSSYFHGNQVKEIKTTYLTSNDFEIETKEFDWYTGNKNSLFDLTSNLNAENYISLQPQMSSLELNLLNKSIKERQCLLEFGIGGSTRIFLENKKQVFSFETSSEWIEKSKNLIKKDLQKNWTYFLIDIGKIKFLGYPENDALIYSYSIQIRNLFKALNNTNLSNLLVFNDGRFRVFTQAISFLFFPKVEILLHDYNNERPHYDIIFEFSEVIESCETMYLTKRKSDVTDEFLEEIIEKYKLDPR